ncbi:hypothetical protein DPMN_124737 [Dreissena polymorpha]|uniref:Uncharacterized protein n=1 Tax=Dreissena polymorpha TaxID=45954 RepID=A0A9D4GW63_DREPO|nr:hypothetical protein DPMN_124737 [Dreissena polymorpha]
MSNKQLNNLIVQLQNDHTVISFVNTQIETTQHRLENLSSKGIEVQSNYDKLKSSALLVVSGVTVTLHREPAPKVQVVGTLRQVCKRGQLRT